MYNVKLLRLIADCNKLNSIIRCSFSTRPDRRAVYQAVVRTTSDQPEPVVPSPGDFAWSKVDDAWTPV